MVFPIPPKKVEKSGDGKWHEVEDVDACREEYKKYDRTVIGRALILSKLMIRSWILMKCNVAVVERWRWRTVWRILRLVEANWSRGAEGGNYIDW
jgi:hypothetical protein